MTFQTNVVILAAGLGTRMKSKRAKVLHRAGGLTLIEHVVHAATSIAPAANATVVVGHQADQVRSLLAPSGVHFVEQTELKGTGHAMLACRPSLSSTATARIGRRCVQRTSRAGGSYGRSALNARVNATARCSQSVRYRRRCGRSRPLRCGSPRRNACSSAKLARRPRRCAGWSSPSTRWTC